MVSANFLIFPSFILLFLYSTVQKSAVQYSYWPAPLSIQRGLEWTQLLKRVFVLCLLVSKFSHFSLFHPSLFIQYSTEECSTVQLLASSLEYPERIRVDSVVETCVCLFFVCLIVSKFSNFFLFHPSLFIQYSTEECSTVQLFIGQLPRVSTEDRVVSVFEPSV